MTAKKYLERIEDLWSVYVMAREKLETMQEQMCAFPAIRYDKEQIDHSVEDTMSENMAKLADYDIDMRKKLMAYMRAVDELQNVLEKLENPDHRLVIWYRYVCDYSTKLIADKLALSTDRIRHMYGEAFTAMEQLPDLKS